MLALRDARAALSGFVKGRFAMQFVVIAHDGDDEGALARRQAVRQAHLDGVREMAEDGRLLAGGAVLSEDGVMVGSVVIVEMADRAAVDRWLAEDPYVTGGVWQRVEVRRFQMAPLPYRPL